MPNPIDVHVGTRLRLKRCMLGLTQRQLSERLDCTEAHVASIEDGTVRIGVIEMIKIAEALRTPIVWFYERP